MGNFISPTTDPVRLLDFLARIYPVGTDHDLIRLGGDSDGGYLLPDDLEGISACFSPGVNQVADFELDLTKRDIKCFLTDASVERPPIPHPLFDFEKKFLGSRTENQFITLAGWVEKKHSGNGDLLLQMDIEGAEYSVIHSSSSALLRRFRIVIIEFHSMDHLFDSFSFEFLRLTFEKLMCDFEVAHIHPNNSQHPVRTGDIVVPPVIEVTFIRKDRVALTTPCGDFPHPLDRANVRKRDDFVLPNWFHANAPSTARIR
jgi:hypothetical protein